MNPNMNMPHHQLQVSRRYSFLRNSGEYSSHFQVSRRYSLLRNSGEYSSHFKKLLGFVSSTAALPDIFN